jgi:hypothetical protein
MRLSSIGSRFGWITTLALLTSAPAFTACSGADDGTPGNDGGSESLGSIGFELETGGVTLNSVDYAITGPSGYRKSGSLNVPKSKTITGVIGGLPQGNGFTITLSAVDAKDANIKCDASATFNISAGATTSLVIKLQCKLPDGKGNLGISGSVNVCPRIDALSIEPAETTVGGTIALASEITDSDQLPSPAAYSWTSSSGTLDGATTALSTFTCTAAGPVTVTLSVSDGDCSDSVSATVTCLDAGPTPPPAIKVNEIESNGGTPGDWVELYNAGSTAVDLSGFVFKDNDDTHLYTVPAGTTIAAGAYLVLEEAGFGFGLGAADSARLYDENGTFVDSHTWSAHATTTYGRCPNGTGTFRTTTSVTKGAANDCSVPVKFTEVESNGGTPGDWVELYNAGTTAVDLSGFVFKDNDDTHSYSLPAGTTIAPGAYLALEEGAFGFGLGANESVRLFDMTGALVDSYSWTAHATTTYGRCPDPSGAFTTTVSSTKGAANACVPTGPSSSAWPGQNDVTTVDGSAVFGGNLSGLTYEPATVSSPAVLWAVRNGPGTLYRLIYDGSIWTPDPANGWGAGKALHYTTGLNNTDSEGVTLAEPGSPAIYVATERNNDASTVSRLSVLRFDTSASGSELTATHDWNLTADLPAVGANLGLEAITWIPDSFLVSKGFFDEGKAHAYNPSEYPNHGAGLFFVGVEGSGIIYVYALDHVSGGFSRVATIASGNTGVMSLEFDRDVGYLWAGCDDSCANELGILQIDATGKFFVRQQFDRPSTLPNVNNEGIAIAPESECSGGFKSFFWTDDGETGGHSLRRDSIPCGPFL